MALNDPNGAGLASLMEARSIAIVGASENSGNPAGRAILYNLQNGFAGTIHPVNPKYETVHGLPTFATLADLPETVDLAIVAVPQPHVIGAIRGAKARNLLVFTDGYRETGNAEAEADLLAAARTQGARLLGPNCLGLMNRGLGLVASFTPAFAQMPRGRDSGIAVISQSGAIGSYFCVQADLAGLLVQEWVSTGNEADLQVCDFLEYYLGRDDIRVLVVQCEGLNVARLSGLLDRLDAGGKLLLIAKGGRSDAGSRAVASHTGAMAGSDAAFDALLRGHRAIRTQSTIELIHLASAASLCAIPAGRNIGILSASGGAAILMADEAADLGIELPDPPAALSQALAELGTYVASNPVDLTGRMISSPTLFPQALAAMADPEKFDALAVYLGGSSTDAGARRRLLTPLAEVRKRLPIFVCGADVGGFGADLAAAGIPLFPDGVTGMRTLAPLAGIDCTLLGSARWNSTEAHPLPPGANSERELKHHLAGHGLNVPTGIQVTNIDEATAAANAIGYPVVLKLSAPGLEHKSDIGGVILGIANAAALTEAAERMARCAANAGIAPFGFLVEQQLEHGVELILSVRRDPQYGVLLVAGLGGVYTELLSDVAVELLPSSDERLEHALRTLRGWPVLVGVRGGIRLDPAALVSAIGEIAQVLTALMADDTIREIELNPVIARPDGLWIADAVAYC